jgi:cytochrome c-type biogenesis protein CcmF
MIPELGHFALILALAVALIGAVVPLWGSATGDVALMGVARTTARVHFALIALSFACLAYSFYTNDFSVENVAANSNSLLPAPYRLAATWGSHEGSLLLWVLMLSGWMLAVSILSRTLPLELVARVLSVMSMISIGFLTFLIFTSNPFRRLIPAPMQGNDLNPLLQDPGMVVHPPMLYMGYVGFSVAFAFAIAALMGRRLDATWARWARPWTTAAWCFLTVGICLGSAWAYYVLGWGGWWFWDPVENASLMPWLVGTALIHSLAVTEKRAGFKSWTVLLAIIAFSMSLLGTFLVRSGVLTSVHAFATDPTRGTFVLVFLAIVIGASLALYAWRAPSIARGPGFTLVSREAALLANNLVFAVAMAAVALGTLYPLILDGLGLSKISVGAPYFNTVFFPLVMPALVMIGFGPALRWRGGAFAGVAREHLPYALGAALCAGIWTLVAHGGIAMALALSLAFWIIGTTLMHVIVPFMRMQRRSFFGRIVAQQPSFYGMHLAHLGIAVFIIGVTLVKNTETELDTKLSYGQSVNVGAYTFRLDSVKPFDGPNYEGLRGHIAVSKNGVPVVNLSPEQHTFERSGQTMTEASISAGLFRQIYVSLGEPIGDTAWSLRIYIKPFVSWIWGGALMMAMGGALALFDRRYRQRLKARVIEPAVIRRKAKPRPEPSLAKS